MNDVILPLLPCSSMCISGQTGSGKTRFVFRLLQNLTKMYAEEPPDAVMYCYGIHQPLFDQMEEQIPNLFMKHGLPTQGEIEEFTKERKHRLVIIDDLAHQLLNNPDMELLFTQGCHHRRLSVIFMTQNLFQKGSKSRTIALNTYYLVLMKNIRDASQIAFLGRQLFPGKSRLLTDAYKDATHEPYGYLLIDASPHSEDKYRLRTHIFPGEYPVIYQSL
ncbi:hypothetical protein FSP39_015044 [Pinctada imbricata]|uniref:AAA+ ATPase domain-containing protein n=1 Tax=Pinctada imbricata TaxID=66713 RepID=A0AA89C7W5_PINIB|nr:hypothetical protein FSP39_020926 [Pinctada imbricata]KAK3105003.1 hypothetical protein FSP39_015044 [Pinctada imbricata]